MDVMVHRWPLELHSRSHRNGKRPVARSLSGGAYCRWKFDGSGLLNLLKIQFCELY
jgi:hypothetical protein